jgi:hypothetical protein
MGYREVGLTRRLPEGVVAAYSLENDQELPHTSSQGNEFEFASGVQAVPPDRGRR